MIPLVCAACTGLQLQPAFQCPTTIFFDLGPDRCKSSDPPEEYLVSDVNIFIFNSVEGILEESSYSDSRNLSQGITVPLLKGAAYDIFACLNFGYPIAGIKTKDDLKALRFHLAYPDEYHGGIPMAARLESFSTDSSFVILRPERMMSRIVLKMDRSLLSDGVSMSVRRVRLVGCPKSMSPFLESRAEGKDDIFRDGFNKTESEADNLNRDGPGRQSSEVCLYMLENLAGKIPSSVTDPSATGVYPYVELEMDYVSKSLHSKPGEWLIYRFCIGEAEGVADIRRNTIYRYTIRPEGSGVEEFSWRVDKSALVPFG